MEINWSWPFSVINRGVFPSIELILIKLSALRSVPLGSRLEQDCLSFVRTERKIKMMSKTSR